MNKLLLLTSLVMILLLVKTSAQCPPITGLTVSNITNTSATFDWDAGPFDGYYLQYRPSYTTTWTLQNGGNLPHQVLSVFSPGTTYELKVTGSYFFGGCSPEPSATITFTTTGSVPPPVPYCTSKGASTANGWIKSVNLGTIINVSGNNNGYANFTNLSTSVPGNTAIPITVQAGAKKTPLDQAWTIFVDLNNDGDFADAGERIVDFVTIAGDPRTLNITIPTTLTGARRMRISMHYIISNGGWACGNFQYGEVEDYTIILTAPVTAPANATSANKLTQSKLPNASLTSNLSVYPIPASSTLNITSTNDPVVRTIIFDAMGKAVITESGFTGSKSIDISNLSAGNYVIVFTTKNGQKTERFIKN